MLRSRCRSTPRPVVAQGGEPAPPPIRSPRPRAARLRDHLPGGVRARSRPRRWPDRRAACPGLSGPTMREPGCPVRPPFCPPRFVLLPVCPAQRLSSLWQRRGVMRWRKQPGARWSTQWSENTSTVPASTLSPAATSTSVDRCARHGRDAVLHLHRLDDDQQIAVGDLSPADTCTDTTAPGSGETGPPLASAASWSTNARHLLPRRATFGAAGVPHLGVGAGTTATLRRRPSMVTQPCP